MQKKVIIVDNEGYTISANILRTIESCICCGKPTNILIGVPIEKRKLFIDMPIIFYEKS